MRLPARELLLDPFLAEQKPEVIFEDSEEVPDPERTTNMSVTGIIDPQDDTIFLRLRISDLDGKC